MNKERYFLITDAESVNKLNSFLELLEKNKTEYETDYEDVRNGILVIVSFEK